jgi:hypothetical protein
MITGCIACLTVYLYDVTSTYFEGQCPRNGKAKLGHSRDKRPCLRLRGLHVFMTKADVQLRVQEPSVSKATGDRGRCPR